MSLKHAKLEDLFDLLSALHNSPTKFLISDMRILIHHHFPNCPTKTWDSLFADAESIGNYVERNTILARSWHLAAQS